MMLNQLFMIDPQMMKTLSGSRQQRRRRRWSRLAERDKTRSASWWETTCSKDTRCWESAVMCVGWVKWMFVSLHLTDVEKMAWWDVCVEMSLFCVSRPFFSRTDSIKTTVCHVRSWTLILTRIILVYTLYLFFYLLSFIAALLALSLLYIS